MKMFKDYYDEDYDSIEEYERGIKPFNDDDDCYQDDCDSCIKHFKD